MKSNYIPPQNQGNPPAAPSGLDANTKSLLAIVGAIVLIGFAIASWILLRDKKK